MKGFISICTGIGVTLSVAFLSEIIGVFLTIIFLIITVLVYNRLSSKEERENITRELGDIKIALDEIRKDRE